MDFRLTTEQIDIQRAAREFAQGEFEPEEALKYDKNQQFPLSIWEKVSKLGFVGTQFPEEYGGPGLGLLENVLIVEALCQQDSGLGMALALSDFGSEMILRYGNENQKKTILPLVTQGIGITTIAYLEDGLRLAPLATTANRKEDRYVIQGKKTFVTLGSLARYLVVVCQTGFNDTCKQSVFVLEREASGVEVSNMGEKVGMRMIPVDRVTFTSVSVSKENIIGKENAGYSQVQDFLNEVRVEAAAIGVGIAQGALDRALKYSKNREAFGKKIVNFGAIRNKLVDMFLEVEIARAITYKAAWSFDHMGPDVKLSLTSKMFASEMAYKVAYDAIQIHGGYGYMAETDVEHFYRDAQAVGLFLDPGQFARDMIAEQIVGRT